MIISIKDWQRQSFQKDGQIENQVSQMLAKILNEGDRAIDELSMKFDNKVVSNIKLKPFEEYQLQPELALAIKTAATRIEKFAHFQKQTNQSQSFDDEYGTYSQNILPIERVGAYIPGGRFPLISTALMTIIPARVAGSPVRIACSPSEHPALLAAASLAGATDFYHIGGVQAIAALAYGYKKIEAVDVIVGPGNAWVNEAKKQLQSRVKIDGLAGPSELLALCDGQQNIEWLALDALAQAEHDPLACSIIASDNLGWLKALLSYLQHKPETKKLLDNKQIELIETETFAELIVFSNQFAPEHLMLCHEKVEQGLLNNYGSLFIGENSAVALGDYISGPNHTLPTLGYARQNGGLNVQVFQKIVTTQSINDEGRKKLSEMAMPLAKEEGLTFHYESLVVRVEE